jgi:transcriptional regulator with XRE-family HTH domain
MVELGGLIKAQRLTRQMSLRALGNALGVTPAYVADIEANRRQPSSELRHRIAGVLGIPVEELQAADNRLTSDLREWIEERPQITSLLRTIQNSPDADMLIQRVTRFFKRRAPRPAAPRGFMLTWESELRAIASESTAWTVETGGDLFGRWVDTPTVLLASKTGPKAQRDHAHFRLDVDYLRHLSEQLAADWSLRYFGDWHSHHRLGLSSPSGGDRKRIRNIAGKNQFLGMAEIIVTLEDTRTEPIIRIHPWMYDLSTPSSDPYPVRIKVLPGLSPVRQALMTRRSLPEQALHAWEKIPLSRIRIGSDLTPPILEPAAEVDPTTRERTLQQLAEALSKASGSPVEQHATGFGNIVVAKITGPHYLAFALGAAWPMPILAIHRMNRDTGSSDPIESPADVTTPDIARVLEVFMLAKAKATGGENVE